ncbi:MAG: hypothetical protein Q7S70_00960 [bacterium]|nr:hypothetical protein [bacterium]
MVNKILPSVTTTKGSDWKKQISEINELGLKEIAIFPTCLDREQRKEFYKLLEGSTVKSIPYCHLRSDMKPEELEYLIGKYQTQAFSTHMQIEFPIIHDWSKYKKTIYIEFVYHVFDEKELKSFGGICLDVTHLEIDRLLRKENYEANVKIIEKNYIGANHVSAVKAVPRIDEQKAVRYDWHHSDDLSEFDYLKRYPLSYFSPFIAIELENSIEEQLKVKDYINNLISEK